MSQEHTTLRQRLESVEDRIIRACARSGRSRDEVRLIAVTKYVSAERMRELMDLGLSHVGENRWQDAAPKWELLGSRGTWHFIGHLQTNKVKDVLGKFAWIHSLDRMSLAVELEKQAAKRGITVNCLVQVNVSGEESKHGLPPEELVPFIREVSQFPHLNITGLMTMAPATDEPESVRPVFAGLRQLRDELNESGILDKPLRDLSMGMSGDFEVAIEEGATWIRVGTALVGNE